MTVAISTAYAPLGKIWGYIRNNSGQPIANASLTLTPGQGSGNSNSAGKYATGFIDYGNYTLTVTASGYQPGGGPVTVNAWSVQKHFYLTPVNGMSAVSSPENDNVSTPELQENAIQMLGDIKNQILSLGSATFKTPDRQDALAKQYDTAVRNIQEGRNDLALKKIQYGILMRVNGCNRLGQADDNDWIIDCEAQKLVYDSTAVVKEIVK